MLISLDALGLMMHQSCFDLTGLHKKKFKTVCIAAVGKTAQCYK